MSLRVGSGLPNIQKSSLLELKIQIPTDLPKRARSNWGVF